ncbi:hypothetical protein [Paenibacillus hexagrammi]|uniref:Uncharacterized protein n=1 Tax=Paenibacillus hexagrammi TaxID=2908839 RepID=A0ABY3SDK0_9BACL|nr:hypothetical protein [Paenibacillus sp. YPD9-1]UJF31299.1 hypothetical protein L0M14_15665 [Paenibacillus sp. YPD9-1]
MEHLNTHTYADIIQLITEEIYEADPSLLEKYGERGKQKCKEDNEHHFKHLETAYALQSKQVFIDYAIWLNGILQKHGMSAQHLIENFERIARHISGRVEPEKEIKFLAYLQEGIRAIE